ncbi:DUF2244 domain-containing protein [Parasulfitobacter algicola]|uniref:DUF2244 domain-containing protein n=1 Tax=Parasulfitobacter algicola TaxID=2614809 RepID=A0ABX2IRP1_9RHOB|nr:DUF2244 domain-containing protein [Sulfitobacter algicola]NSX54686.1 DUF2244 domain-containing protein [Sulfitobacter algicola]
MPLEHTIKIKEAPDNFGAFLHQDGAGQPLAKLSMWPYRSLPRKGFVIFIGITAALVLMPILAVIGSPVVWGLLPFFLLMLWAVWYALERSYIDGSILEELTIWSDHAELIRHNPRGPSQHWAANTHWVNVKMHEKDGPVPFYVTLSGAGREVEIGAFLSEDERKILFADLSDYLRRVKT